MSDSQWEMIKLLLMTFEHERRVYLDSLEWVSVCNLWRMSLLNAGITGKDDGGKYQLFAISTSGKSYLNRSGVGYQDDDAATADR